MASTSNTPELPAKRPDRKRRIVVCCDGSIPSPLFLILGTWQASDDPDSKQQPSNVTLISKTIVQTGNLPSILVPTSPKPSDTDDQPDDGFDQLVFYFAGVATHEPNWFRRIICAASGEGLVARVREAYVTIATHWRPGDEIYLFGFSRGAYTARTVGGLIAGFGLLKPEVMKDRFYELLKQLQQRENSPFTKKPEKATIKAADWLGETVSVRCIGVWDTVGSMGIPNMNLFGVQLNSLGFIKTVNEKYSFPDKFVSEKVEFAFHA